MLNVGESAQATIEAKKKWNATGTELVSGARVPVHGEGAVDRSVLLRLGSLCPDFSRAVSQGVLS